MRRTLAGLQFPVPVAAHEDVLGRSFFVRIGKRTAQLHTPRVLPDDEWHQLGPPVIPGAEQVAKLGGGRGWGHVYLGGVGHPIEAAMDAVLLEFADLQRSEATDLWPQVHAWLARLADWVEVLSKQALEPSAVDEPRPVTADYWLEVDDGGELDVFNPMGSVTASVMTPGPAITGRAWQDALARADGGEPLPLPYQLLNDARAALRRGYAGKAVLDASTAVEIVVGDRLRPELEHRLGRNAAKQVLERTWQISARVRLARGLGIGLPEKLK